MNSQNVAHDGEFATLLPLDITLCKKFWHAFNQGSGEKNMPHFVSFLDVNSHHNGTFNAFNRTRSGGMFKLHYTQHG